MGRTTLLLALAIYLLSCLPVTAAPPTADSVRQLLAHTDQIIWQGQNLRAGLTNLTQTWNIPIFLDRRVDPNQLVEFEGRDQPRDQLLRALAAQLGLKVCLVDTVIYLGPPATADVVATIAEARFDQAAPWGARGRALRKRTPLAWDEAAEPRGIVAQLANESGMEITNLDVVVHDLWPAANWASLPVSHQLALLLAGFGLTYEFSAEGKSMKLIPMPATFSLTRTYRLAGNAAQRVASLKDQFPEAVFSVRNRMLTVEGPAEVHFWVRRRMAGLGEFTPRAADPKNLRYTLNVEQQPFGAIARTIAKSLQLELQFEEGLDDLQNRRVDLQTRDATRDELLEALAKAAGVRYTIENQTLRIHQ